MTESHYRDALADQALDVEILRRERLCNGFRDFDAVTVTHESLNGTQRIGPLRREILSTGSVVVLVPYDPKLDRLVVIRQFRIGSALKTAHAAAIEFPAGVVDEGEDPDETARRELFEETGIEAKAVERCFSMLPSPGLTDEHAFIYLAIVDASHVHTSAGLSEEHEDIRPIAADADALVRAVDEGRIENGFVIACAHWFARHGRARAASLAAALDASAETG